MGVVQQFPISEAKAFQRRASFFDLSNWSRSRKGNLFIVTPDGTVTTFMSWNGWSWAIARGRGSPVMYSSTIYDSEDAARQAAWDELTRLSEQSA